ncbi:hypothetical protein IQ283_02215 [Alkalihalobacillus hwajinpoensis]|uniref:hypothetical protein n=1 Tax=Guptibacillus hwajinpoensis TaxID=208199 RepID=UPI0018832562|nr:hypothetical protein [Pseudalkalibacillus hwajinpoensis]MBF0705405.1 hypothetical protein [Pseudalkalibacillus hwajinpoensis]
MENLLPYSFDQDGNLELKIPSDIFDGNNGGQPPVDPPAGGNTLDVTVEDYGAIPNEASKASQNRAAIQRAINENNYIVFPGKYYIDAPLLTGSTKYTVGRGMNKSGLIGVAGMDAPLFIFENGFNSQISDMELSYGDWAPGQNRNAILFRGQVAHSNFRNLRFISVTRALFIDPTSTIGGNVFSNNFENLYTFWYSANAYHLKARSGANTGNVLSNLYCNNGQPSNRYQGTVTPFYFEELSESTMIQLNAEWSNIDSAYHFKYCRNINLLSAHIEGLNMKTQNRGLFRVEGISGSPNQKGSLRIIGIDLYSVKCDVPGYVFQPINNGIIYAHDMNEQVTEGTLKLVHTTAAGDDYLYLENIRYSKITDIEPPVKMNSNGKPKLMKFNDDNRYLVVSGTDGQQYQIQVENGSVRAKRI